MYNRFFIFGAVGLVAAAGTTIASYTARPTVHIPVYGLNDSLVQTQAELVELLTIGTSAQGQPIQVWQLGEKKNDGLGRGPGDRPGLLIVAGIDGRYDFGTRLALSLIDRIAADHADLLKTHTVYVLPNLNPDNDALFDQPGMPRANFGKAPRKGMDADHDRRADEDPAEDLNGDGMITMMRIKDPSVESGLTADMVIDKDEPRIMRAPDGEKHEIANYAVLIEGIDNDSDGQFNEDGFAGSKGGGIDLNKNFPSLWPEHDPDAGRYQLSEPETKALVDWMLTRDNIVVTLTLGPTDTILNTPATGKYASDGSEPIGIEAGDEDIYKQVKEAFKAITNQTGAPKGDRKGAFDQWAYAHFGVFSFSTPGWVRPDLVKEEKKDDDDNANEADSKADDKASVPDPEIAKARDREELTKQGVPDFVIDFLLASKDERAEMMAGFEDLSPEEQASRMKAMNDLPSGVQERMRSLISGQPDRSMAPNKGKRAGKGKDKGKDATKGDDAKWLAYSDQTLGGAGFVDWTPFDHPQLGMVEIGGFVPGIKHEPPEADWSRVADEQTEFVAKLLDMMPTLEVRVQEVHQISEGLWRITVRGIDDAAMPTRSSIGTKANRLVPIVVHLGVDVDDIVSGQRDVRWTAIAGAGGYKDASWLLNAPDGATVQVQIRSSVFGDRTLDVPLHETAPTETKE